MSGGNFLVYAASGKQKTICPWINAKVRRLSCLGTKTWVDNENKYNTRPDSITVKLFADGEDTGKTAELNADNGWSYKFTGLDKYNAQQTEIVYTVDETAVPTGYDKSASGMSVTNTLAKGETEATASHVLFVRTSWRSSCLGWFALFLSV